MSEKTTPIEFSKDELWLLQRFIRHEMGEQQRWHNPPVSLTLNDQVADALRVCETMKVESATLLLSKADCYAIDYTVPSDAKSQAGVLIGKAVLVKSYEARYVLENGLSLTAAEPALPSRQQINEAVKQTEE